MSLCGATMHLGASDVDQPPHHGDPTSVCFDASFPILYTQCSGVKYLLGAIKHPQSLQDVHIQSNQVQTHFLRRLGAAGAGAASSSSSIDGRSRPL